MTLNEALIEAEELKKRKQANEIISLLTPFWEEKVTVSVGAFLAYSYRRLEDYEKCLEICDIVDKAANFPSKIKAQRQWCLIFRDIINQSDHEKAESIALETITKLNINNSYDFSVFRFICLTRAEENQASFDTAIEWYERIPSHKLDSKMSVYEDEGTGKSLLAISQKHQFYRSLVEYLLEYGYLNNYLNKILVEFSPLNKAIFIEAVQKACEGESYQGDVYFKKRKLENILMHIKESAHYIKYFTILMTDSLRMSDVAAYVFCPISSVISKTLLIQELSIEYNESIAYSKKYLNDYFEIIKNKKEPWEDILFNNSDWGFEFTESQSLVLSKIFSSQRLALNSAVGSPAISNIFKGEDISFSPDMVMQKGSEKYCVEEVFTSNPVSSLSGPFENDRIKVTGYLTELNIPQGYLIYWNVIYTENDNHTKKRATISGMKIFEITLTKQNVDQYRKYKDQLKNLISVGNQITLQINYNKCVNCSVMHYCVHKYGNSKTLLYPYKLNYNAY